MNSIRRALVVVVAGLCVVSIAASCFLALSYTALKGLGDLRPLAPLLLFVLQSAVTLLALSAIVSGLAINLLAFGGAVGLAWLGYSMVAHTLSSAHFEGYALVLGAVGVLQGVLTVMLFRVDPYGQAFIAHPRTGSSRGAASIRRAES